MKFFNRLILFLYFSLCSVAAPVWAQQQAGEVVSVIGEVMVERESQASLPLRARDGVFVNDTLLTGEGSYAKLLLSDDSILKVGANSRLVLTEVLVGVDQQQTVIKQVEGRLRSIIGKKLKPLSKYEITTPVAVAGVRGTDFEVWVKADGKSAVRCYEGVVAVRNIDDDEEEALLINANYFTVVEKNESPTEPQRISPQTPLTEALPEFGGGDANSGTDGGEGNLNDILDSSELIDSDVVDLGIDEEEILDFDDTLMDGSQIINTESQGVVEQGGQLDTITDQVISDTLVDVPINITIPTP